MKRRLLLLGAAAALVTLIALALNDVAKSQIETVARIIYIIVRGLLDRFPPILLWLFIVLYAIFNAGKTLMLQKRIPKPPELEENQFFGRVETLARWIRQVPEGSSFKWRVSRYLSNLALDALGHREKLTISELKQLIETEQIDLPPKILAYIQAGIRARQGEEPTSKIDNLIDRLRKKVMREPAYTPDPDLVGIIEFLEDELEVNRDH